MLIFKLFFTIYGMHIDRGCIRRSKCTCAYKPPKWVLITFLDCSHFIYWWGFSLNPEITDFSSSLLARLPKDPLSLPPKQWACRKPQYLPSSYSGLNDLKTRLHPCGVSTLSTKPSPQPISNFRSLWGVYNSTPFKSCFLCRMRQIFLGASSSSLLNNAE